MGSVKEILQVLDGCCESYTFPMLDNGYVYLAATRLSLHRSAQDWALVIEVFGFSPRSGLPDIHVYSFGSRLHARDKESDYKDKTAYAAYLEKNPHNESRFFAPVGEGDWQDEEDSEVVAEKAKSVLLRGKTVAIPSVDELEAYDIEPEDPPRIQIFELCRFLAASQRDLVLATPAERRVSVAPELEQILVLDAWHHPDVVNDERPSASATFQQLAQVLVTGDVSQYRPVQAPNTHWSKWPGGGQL